MPTTQSPSSVNAALARVSVLVVEDEPFARTVAVRVLEGLGCRVVYQAGDGVTALALLRAHSRAQPIDVVMCDINMKPVTGIELLSRLRTSDQPGERALPVLFLSGRTDPDEVSFAHGLGHTLFLLKPIQPAQVAEGLLQLLHPELSAAATAPATAETAP